MNAVGIFELILVLLAAVVALHWIAARLGLPPSATLLVGGGTLALIPGLPAISLDPELALVLFLPPLLMDGAYYTAFGRFRRHLPGILSLAVGSVLFTTFAVGVVAHLLLPHLPWAACFALGAIVSPPDAIAARAVLQRVVLPRRLQALLEGESLLNDATGLVLFRFAVVATLTGVFEPAAAIGEFVLLAVGGVVVGLTVAASWIFVLRRLTDETLLVALATLLCWAAYLAGEALHVSGVIATVTAGIVFGWMQHIVLAARVRLQGSAFWRTLVFALEALVFILMGFSLRSVLDRVGGLNEVFGSLAIPVFGIVVAVIVARFAWVFGIEVMLTWLRKANISSARPLGWRQASVLGWTGMRGVVTLAVALTLPQAMPGRDVMLVAAFAVILVTVVGQGATLGRVILLARLTDDDPPAPLGPAQAEAAVAHAKLAAAERLAHGPNGELVHPQLLETYRSRARATDRYAGEPDAFMANIRPHFDAMLAATAAGRAELIRLQRQGQIEDEVLHDLERDLDLEELGIILQRGTEAKPPRP
jgi:CPA1 family monovalent cation:H+ antiporter